MTVIVNEFVSNEGETNENQSQSFGQPLLPQKGPEKPPLCEEFENSPLSSLFLTAAKENKVNWCCLPQTQV